MAGALWSAVGPVGGKTSTVAAMAGISMPGLHSLKRFSGTKMPNTKSAAKRLRQNLARRARNRARKSMLRTQIRNVREAIKAGDVAKAESEYQVAAASLDRCAARNVIHRNKAARTKSRLQKAIKTAKQTA